MPRGDGATTGMAAAEVARRVRPEWADRPLGRGATLDRAVAKRVTIISAPADSGKTSLLHAWADWPGQGRRITIVEIR
jgi:ATP/maltotriose-dependent transcriptional regulator MalT